MLKAADKANCLAPALVGENCERVEEKEKNCQRAAGRSCPLKEIFRGA
jgi:hypothetical protein